MLFSLPPNVQQEPSSQPSKKRKSNKGKAAQAAAEAGTPAPEPETPAAGAKAKKEKGTKGTRICTFRIGPSHTPFKSLRSVSHLRAHPQVAHP